MNNNEEIIEERIRKLVASFDTWADCAEWFIGEWLQELAPDCSELDENSPLGNQILALVQEDLGQIIPYGVDPETRIDREAYPEAMAVMARKIKTRICRSLWFKNKDRIIDAIPGMREAVSEAKKEQQQTIHEAVAPDPQGRSLTSPNQQQRAPTGCAVMFACVIAILFVCCTLLV